jgi:hypothetical protein
MDFANAAYNRGNRPDVDDTLIMPFDGISVTGSLEDGLEANTLEYLEGAFSAPQTVNLLEWIEIPNPLGDGYGVNIANFVFAANDAARSIEFIHNYAIPDDLYCKYLPDDHVLFDLSNFQCTTTD